MPLDAFSREADAVLPAFLRRVHVTQQNKFFIFYNDLEPFK
jgi:hypothetical protein